MFWDREIKQLKQRWIETYCRQTNTLRKLSKIRSLTHRAAEKYLADHKPKKEPLFITEDGVEIYSGYEFWRVNKYTFTIKLLEYTDIKQDDFFEHNVTFSTKKLAEEYIAKHKVQFSAMDFLKLLPDEGRGTELLEKIENLSKNKIKVD